LAYATAEVADDKKKVVPDANIPFVFSVSDIGEIAATGNANPFDMTSF